jgi:hypothetical protein
LDGRMGWADEGSPSSSRCCCWLDGWVSGWVWVSFQGGGQSSCRYFDRLCGKGNSMWSRGPSFNRTSPAHMPRGGTGRCWLGRGDDGSVHLVTKCGEEYCTASNSTLNSLLVWKTAQPCAAKRRLPPSRPPASSRRAAQLAQPDDEQIVQAAGVYRAVLAVRLRRWSGRCWLAGHTVDRSIEAYSWEVTMAMTILHRPVCIQ